jgi:hypothetical protein
MRRHLHFRDGMRRTRERSNLAQDVFARDDGDDAWCLQGFADINVADASMGIRAAQDGGVTHSWQLHIVHISPFTRDQARVFHPLEGLTDQFGHDFSPP